MEKMFYLSKKGKRHLAIYLSWCVLNFVLLCFGNIDNFGTNFWPFNGEEIDEYYDGGCGYDWFEFFVYTVGPIIIGIIIKLFKDSRSMQEILYEQSKETRCFIMSAIMTFEGFNQMDELTEIRGKVKLDDLNLTTDDMENFPMPNFTQIVSHLKDISNSEVQHWIITNTYSPVLESQRKDALCLFRMFCMDLNWDINEILKTMKLTEEFILAKK
ncbi:MAG: hypothetical protein MJZ52_06540 [Bacteroidales bacterium]|nr:hypothetical protein [Bacteroidales bacterium]